MSEIADLTIAEAAAKVSRRELSSRELVDATLKRIAETEPQVHAYATVMAQSARKDADRVDKDLARGVWAGPLSGIPIALKDLVYTTNAPTEAGSKVLEGWIPPYDAAVIERLRSAGAVVIGKTHTHEFAYGVNIPPTRNPWRLDCYPGGSSAGSGVSVAVRSAFGSIGTDGGGSIRCPASVNSVVGLKPTNGRVSRRGVVPMSATFDTVGPLTRTVEDNALMLTAMAGYDRRDPISLDVDVPDFTSGIDRGVKSLRIGIDREFFFSSKTTSDVRKSAEEALDFYAAQGAQIVEIRIPELFKVVSIAMPVILADTTAYHRSWIRHRAERYEPATRVMIELGEIIPATHYATAQRARRLLRERVREAFGANRLDALFAPTIPGPTVPVEDLGLDLTDGSGESVGSSYFRQCVMANTVGIPALSFPGGFSGDDLPIGLALFGRPLDEAMLFRIARAYEAAHPWHERKPTFRPAPVKQAASKAN
jgi:aspartyl-tRNA(Asn)/glutamyl-tRNA(Gln) amidotransferase subunit A